MVKFNGAITQGKINMASSNVEVKKGSKEGKCLNLLLVELDTLEQN